VKSIPDVNFISILRAAFALKDPKSIKKIDNLTVFLCFWDLRVKAARKTMVKSTPDKLEYLTDQW